MSLRTRSQRQRADVVAEARAWVGTPFHHQGRLKGVGVDCGGLILGVGKALGLLDAEIAPNYGRRPNGSHMRDLCAAYLDARALNARAPGDVLLFAFADTDQHLGILSERNTLIHAFAQARACVEHQFDARWRSWLSGVYAYRGLD